ncbi:MAG: dihydroorotase, partial [Synechococcaceae cyanobacterium]|nr:dihydroorotase [Synechococcaceae cyanobacterium]
NVSTLEGVELLRGCAQPPPASVCWWHLVADSGRLDPAEEGWRLVPSLGGASDREALIAALAEGRITAVAIHHRALDSEERLLPLDQRRPGLAGHGVALTLLWEELVGKRGWPVEQLWQALCWGPSRFLGTPPVELTADSRDWLLFDPDHHWRWDGAACPSLAANQACWNRDLRGRVIACGAADAAAWPLTALRSR